MAKHDAVDRLMALATEKRADRTPTAQAGSSGEVLRTSLASGTSSIGPEPSRALPIRPPELVTPSAHPTSSAGDRGRRLLKAIQPLLPAVAGAMRLVDHGAVQAVARLLPLLGGAIDQGQPSLAPQSGDAAPEREQQWKRDLTSLQASSQATRRDLDALLLQAASAEDELRRSRSQIERLTAEVNGRTQELRTITDRVRMLIAATIILFMLVVAQMILLVVMFHR